MLIQLNTDKTISGTTGLAERVQDTVRSRLERFGSRLTRIEVHLSDENGAAKSGPADIRCRMEARPAGMQPVTVTDQAATVDQATVGAADKLRRALETTFAKADGR